MRKRLFAALFMVAVLPLAAGIPVRAQEPGEVWPTQGWRKSKPEDQGLDPKVLKKLVRRIRDREIGSMHSLLIVRHGRLVVEEYFRGWRPEDLHTLQSDTKSVTSLLVGAAIQQGKLAGVDEKVVELFPEFKRIKHMDDFKASMRVQDLLTMRTGFDWSESNYDASPLKGMNECRCDWLRFVIDWPMREAPGTRFEYNSGGVILLAGILRNATGLPTDEFARRALFDPLGIRQATWVYDINGVPHTGGGLFLTSRDMAKLGLLVLRRGRWESRQIVSEDWIRASMRAHVASARTFGPYIVDYGYLWWLFSTNGSANAQAPEDAVYAASGALGQWIFIVPKHDLVVVATGDAQSYGDFVTPVELLFSDVLRAVR